MIQKTDQLSYELIESLRSEFEAAAQSYEPHSNIFLAFFHDLVVHFSGIVIHRETVSRHDDKPSFPWVNQHYALNPFDDVSCAMIEPAQSNRFGGLKGLGVIPVSLGPGVSPTKDFGKWVGFCLKAALPSDDLSKFFLPKRREQLDHLMDAVLKLCRDLDIPNSEIVQRNWLTYARLHTTDQQKTLRKAGALIGNRNNLQNRKIAASYLQQEKPVIGFTHGEINNEIYDEPVYAYSDRTFCTVVVDYGNVGRLSGKHRPLLQPAEELRRSSMVVRRVFAPNDKIVFGDLSNLRALLIPTVYQNNFLYGPARAFETVRYSNWHKAIIECIPNVSFKIHPKTRAFPDMNTQFEKRALEECLDDYDFFIFDFLATGAVQALFSEKPIIYFDIGLRNLQTEFHSDLKERCAVIPINFDLDWAAQIRKGLERIKESKTIYKNTQLAKYSLHGGSQLSVISRISDIIRTH